MKFRPLLLASVLVLAFQAAAQSGPVPATPAPPLSLNQILLAARDNLDVSLARRALAAAQADITSADHAPVPQMSAKMSSIDLQNGIGGGNLFSGKRIDKSIGVDWTLERGNKRALRTEAARRAAAAAQADLEETQQQQQLAAGAAYYDLLAAQERVVQVSALERSAAELATVAARRVKAGDLAQQEATRIEIEAQRARADLLGAQLDRERVALVLAQLAGLGVSSPAAPLAVLPEWPEVAEIPALEVPAVALRADVRAAQQRLQAAQAGLQVAQAQTKSDLTLGTSFDHFPGTSNRMLEVRLQVPLQGLLGTYDSQGEIARAQAQLAQSQDAADKVQRVAVNELQRLQHELRSAVARARSSDAEILPRARQAAAMAELAYSKGAMALTDLIDARRTLRATLLDNLAARTDHAKALVAWRLRAQPVAATPP